MRIGQCRSATQESVGHKSREGRDTERPAPFSSKAPYAWTNRNPLHHLSKRLFADLYQSMQVIGHPAKRVETSTVFLKRFSDDGIKHAPIFSARENILAVISSQDNVIAAAGDVQSG